MEIENIQLKWLKNQRLYRYFNKLENMVIDLKPMFTKYAWIMLINNLCIRMYYTDRQVTQKTVVMNLNTRYNTAFNPGQNIGGYF